MENLAEIIDTYTTPQAAIEAVRSVRSVLLVGISGAGKDTIKQRLLATNKYHDVVSHTTRLPRKNQGIAEVNDVDYHFVDKNTMVDMLHSKQLVEINKYGDNLYATSTKEFEAAYNEEKICIVDVDVNGVAALKAIAPSMVCPVFLTPPNFNVWFDRWKKRYGDSYEAHMDDFVKRRDTAIEELRHALAMPYYLFVVNDDLDSAVKEVTKIAESGTQTKSAYLHGREKVEKLLNELLVNKG